MLLEIQDNILDMLKEKLPVHLSYHNYEHTLDVMKATERIARAENANEDEILLLKTAAAFHDVGYIYSRDKHEEKSCSIAKELMSARGVDKNEIEKICELILATIVPQKPKDKLSEIICDADLDYLGRDDYFKISQRVFNEFKTFGIVKDENEWKQIQINFFESHHYFTKTAIETRKKMKEENLKRIKENIVV